MSDMTNQDKARQPAAEAGQEEVEVVPDTLLKAALKDPVMAGADIGMVMPPLAALAEAEDTMTPGPRLGKATGTAPEVVLAEVAAVDSHCYTRTGYGWAEKSDTGQMAVRNSPDKLPERGEPLR